MGRIKQHVEVGNNTYWALFDTGSRNTYVIKKVAAGLINFDLPVPQAVSLGGETHSVSKCCWLDCKIEGLPIQAHARILDKIGLDEDGKKIEVLIGALTMQEWGIRPIPESEGLDMSHYPKEFVEF